MGNKYANDVVFKVIFRKEEEGISMAADAF
jgi:hypothetical protein